MRVDRTITFSKLLTDNLPKGMQAGDLAWFDSDSDSDSGVEWAGDMSVYNALRSVPEKKIYMREKEQW